MFKHILVPTDGSPTSDEVVRHAIDLAQRLGAKITCFHAIGTFHASDAVMNLYQRDAEGCAKAALAYANERMRHLAHLSRDSGVSFDVDYATNDDPADAIIHAAQSRECDLIMMASHGRHGVERLLLGSETQKVLAHSRVPVLVFRVTRGA